MLGNSGHPQIRKTPLNHDFIIDGGGIPEWCRMSLSAAVGGVTLGTGMLSWTSGEGLQPPREVEGNKPGITCQTKLSKSLEMHANVGETPTPKIDPVSF